MYNVCTYNVSFLFELYTDCLQIIKEKISEEKNIKFSTSTGITATGITATGITATGITATATVTTHGLAVTPTYTSSVSQKSNANSDKCKRKIY